MEKSLKEPCTFDEWLACLEEFSKNDKNRELIYTYLENGAYEGSESMKNALKENIVKYVNVYLQNSTSKFSDCLNYAIQFNDFSNIEKNFYYLKKDFSYLYFFKDYDFISKDFINELETSIKKQINKFINDLKLYIRNFLLSNKNSNLEDLSYILKKYNFEGLHE